MKTILVPTDLSPVSLQALEVAVELARAQQANIILLHTVLYKLAPVAVADCMTGMSYDLGPVYSDAWNDAEKAMKALLANPAYADVPIKAKLGSNREGLIQDISEQPADLIVVGSKGVSGLMEWLEGSNAELITRFATCPVLIVKEKIEGFNPQHAVIGIDLDEKLKKPHTYPFPIRKPYPFVYVLTPSDGRQPEGIRQWVATFAKESSIGDYQLDIVWDKTIPAGLLHYAEDVQADLIVLFTHGYKGIRHWLQGSVAEDVLNHSSIPVLVMRA